MITIWFFSLTAALLIAAFSLVGYFALLIPKSVLERSLPIMISLAVGVLLGDAFIHLIPDALARIGSIRETLLWTLGGMLLFFILEKVVRWQHHHDLYVKPDRQAVARMNLIGDGLHNFIDGALVAGRFSIDTTLGLTTTIAIIAHEIPQEIGDIGALLYGGYTPRRAAFVNFVAALTAVAGAAVTLLIGTYVEQSLIILLPIAAGGFIYIASSDMIPVLHNESSFAMQMGQSVVIASGVSFMLLINVLETLFIH